MTGLMLGTAAILLIVIPQGSLPDPSDIPWILLACLGSAFYALESIIISAKMPMKQSPVVVACVSNFIAVILLGPIVFGTGNFFILNWPLDSAGRAILGVSVISMLAYTLYIYVIKHSGPPVCQSKSLRCDSVGSFLGHGHLWGGSFKLGLDFLDYHAGGTRTGNTLEGFRGETYLILNVIHVKLNGS